MHDKTSWKNKVQDVGKRNLFESFHKFNMQELFDEHNSIETIEILEATNTTGPKVSDILSH